MGTEAWTMEWGNVILLNMNAAFWKYVNLANSLLPTSQQADVSSHTGNYISNCGWLCSFIQAFISTRTARYCGFLSTVPLVCIFSMSHPVLLTTCDTATQSWQFNRLSTQDKFFQGRDECKPLRAWHVYMYRWFSGHELENHTESQLKRNEEPLAQLHYPFTPCIMMSLVLTALNK